MSMTKKEIYVLTIIMGLCSGTLLFVFPSQTGWNGASIWEKLILCIIVSTYPWFSNMITMEKYYLLSFKHTRGNDILTWWKPKNNGYTWSLKDAGKYTLKQINKNIKYYNNQNTIPVPCSFVYNRSCRVVVNDSSYTQLFADESKKVFGEPKKY
jgi:hypothetical protein